MKRPRRQDAGLERCVSFGTGLVQGKMNHGMEDYIVAESRNVDGHELGLFAIFDGHSGRDVAEYLQAHLFDNILMEHDFWVDPVGAFRRAYKATDGEILERVVGSRGGSTAVTAIVIDGERLIVAGAGDSRAILFRDGAAKQITVDHEPRKDEKRLVENRGGSVPRVDGQLAMTRAFGDKRLKKHITAVPDVGIETINGDTEFMILASDGLWKVMDNDEAADCIGRTATAEEAAEELIKAALFRESPDDISCIVVRFGVPFLEFSE